ncbi:MAG: hypothetical protein AAGF94_06490 [Pseudomonadota bacterium]
MDLQQIFDDVKRGWTAPILLVIVCTLMTAPLTALFILLMGGLFQADMSTATAFGGIFQIIVTFWIAGFRLRRSGR